MFSIGSVTVGSNLYMYQALNKHFCVLIFNFILLCQMTVQKINIFR